MALPYTLAILRRDTLATQATVAGESLPDAIAEAMKRIEQDAELRASRLFLQVTGKPDGCYKHDHAIGSLIRF